VTLQNRNQLATVVGDNQGYLAQYHKTSHQWADARYAWLAFSEEYRKEQLTGKTWLECNVHTEVCG
jgi:hypothetical protein